jgi:hypothetical protein
MGELDDLSQDIPTITNPFDDINNILEITITKRERDCKISRSDASVAREQAEEFLEK